MSVVQTPRDMVRVSVRSTFIPAVVAVVACSGLGMMNDANANPRSTFPGRRVGGGSRGECSARTLVHLVPETSVYAPDAFGLVGLLQGPSNSPVSLQVTLKPEDGSAASTELLAAGPASVVLFDMQAKRPVVWESSFSCGSREDQDSSDPLAFVQSTSPPALSLLVSDPEPSDQSFQSLLTALRAKCGTSVSTVETMVQFGLSDLATNDWPQQLPIRCEF